MKDAKALKALAAVVLLTLAVRLAVATTIEGYTPTGQFQTVLVSDEGRLFVDLSTGQRTHVFVDGGTVAVSAVLSSVPVNVLNTPLEVTLVGSSVVPVSVGGSTVIARAFQGPTLTGSTFTVNGVARQVLSADPDRLQSVVCNNDTGSLLMFYGDASVNSTYPPLFAGSCLSPDGPAAYTGALYVNSTAAVAGSVTTVRTP